VISLLLTGRYIVDDSVAPDVVFGLRLTNLEATFADDDADLAFVV
jgi:hypothetical protein